MKLQFVELENFEVDPKNKKQPLQAASYVKKEIVLKEKPVKAELVMTALGVYEAKINGKRVGDQILTPGFTNYHRRLQYQCYDVTDLLRQGGNEILVVVGNGWYRGNVGAFNNKCAFGTKLALAARLTVTYGEEMKGQGNSQACGGECTEVFETDETWKAAQDGPLGENDLKTWERYDATRKPTAWHPCRVISYDGVLIPEEAPPLREQERFAPKILNTPDGNTVLDFGQNICGQVRFRVNGTAGTKVTLQLGETLDEQGNFTLANLQGDGKNEMMLVNQKLEYTLAEGEQVYQAMFLMSGFRYALLSEWPEEVRPENFEAVAVYSDLAYTGDFTCSNENINQFVKNVRWAMKSNFVDIPTDCPHRERAGWAGDVNVFLETADYLADTRGFITKWMKDFVGAQKTDGALPYIIPEIPAIGAGDSSAGWSDAIATVPMTQYLFYGDDSEIRRAYEAVKRFVEYNRTRAGKKHPLHLFKGGAHYRYILDTGFHYGEWLEPGSSNIKGAVMAMVKPDEEVATAWFYYTTSLLAQMAHIIGEEQDEKTYRELAEKIKDAYRKEFVHGGIRSDRQCKYVRPIYMGLLTKEEAEACAKALDEMIRKNDYKIGTGFLTTYRVLQVLTDYGYTDTAYRMLEQEECPGWLYEVKCGATTTWEGWDAVEPQKNALKPLSQNHFSPGAAASWLFSHCAGIRPLAPGFAQVEIAPVPGGSLTYARASYESIKGLIVSEWSLEGEKFTLNVTIPEGIKARIVLPDQTVIENAASGCYHFLHEQFRTKK